MMAITVRYSRATARSMSRSALGFTAVWSRLRMPVAAGAVLCLLIASLSIIVYRSTQATPPQQAAIPLSALSQTAVALATERAQTDVATRSPASPQGNLRAEQQQAGANAAEALSPTAASQAGVSGANSLTPAPNAAARAFNWSPTAKHAQTGSADRVALFIAQHYSIALEAARMIAHEAYAAAAQEKIDPLLSLSVMAVESRFNPFSASVVGALGLTQTLPSAHPEEMKLVDNRREKLLDVGANIRAGARILAACEKRFKGNDALALQCYNGSVSDSSRKYSGKVLAIRASLRQALWAPVPAASANASRAARVEMARPKTAPEKATNLTKSTLRAETPFVAKPVSAVAANAKSGRKQQSIAAEKVRGSKA